MFANNEAVPLLDDRLSDAVEGSGGREGDPLWQIGRRPEAPRAFDLEGMPGNGQQPTSNQNLRAHPLIALGSARMFRAPSRDRSRSAVRQEITHETPDF